MSIPPHLKVSRNAVRVVHCPDCGAPPRIECKGVRGKRTANHKGRVNTFIAWRDKVIAK